MCRQTARALCNLSSVLDGPIRRETQERFESAIFVTTIRRGVTRTEGNRPEAISSYAALRPMPRICCTSRTLSTSRAFSKLPLRFILCELQNEKPRSGKLQGDFSHAL